MGWEGVVPPREPANYDPANKYADPVTYYKHREALVAQEFLKVADAKVRGGWVSAAGAAAWPAARAAPQLLLMDVASATELQLELAARLCRPRCAGDPQAAEAVLQGGGGELPGQLPRAGAGARASARAVGALLLGCVWVPCACRWPGFLPTQALVALRGGCMPAYSPPTATAH